MTATPTATPAGAPPVEDPFVGLTYFTEEHEDRFFGRERECALIIGNLRAARLTLLYAESGVGKSSVLRAGVVARLRRFAERASSGRDTPRLVPVVFSSWGERPVAALVHAISAAIEPHLANGGGPELPDDDLVAAIEAAGKALDATLLIVLDQFEEHFLYPEEAPEHERFVAQLARCLNRADLRANFLISIREDSYARLGDLFRGKVNNVYGNFLHLEFLGRAGAREAIERPIERINELSPDAEPFAVEPALVDAVLDQVGHEEATAEDGGDGTAAASDAIETTYLQLVMRRLWEEEVGAGSRLLRLATLERLGGAQAIIASHLDRAMEGGEGGGGLSREQRLVAASIFRFLVTSGGTKIALSASDLADLSGLSEAEIDPILRHLSSSRLHILRPVVFEGGGKPRFEIFHDALAVPIREWRTRVEEEEREERAKREREEKEAAQRAAAEAERQALQERQRKRLAQALLALAVAALLVGAAYFAAKQKSLADRRDADNQSVRAAERISELARAPTFGPAAAALAGVEAYRLAPTTEAREEALAQLQLNPGLPRIAVGHSRLVETVAFWPGSDRFATGGTDATVRLWNGNGRELGTPLITPSPVRQVAVSEPLPDGTRLLAAGMASGGLELWWIDESGTVEDHLRLPVGGLGELWGVAFDPRAPDLLAVGGTAGKVWLLDLRRPSPPGESETRLVPGGVNGLAFDASGRRLFVASSGVSEELELAGRRFAPGGPIHRYGTAAAVATAPNGSYAFSGPGGIKLWDAVRRRALRLHPLGKVEALAFAHGGSVLVSGGVNWNVTTWDVASGRPFGPPRAMDKGRVSDVAVSPAGDTIAAAGERLVKLWPLRSSHALATTVGGLDPGEVSGVPSIFSLAVGRGRVAAAAGAAGTSIWSLYNPDLANAAAHPIARIPGRSFAVAYRGGLLVTGRGHSFVVDGIGPTCRDGGADPCPLARPARAYSERPVESLVLTRQGSRLLLASTGYLHGKDVLNLWDLSGVTKGGPVVHLVPSPAGAALYGLAFSPTSPLLAAAAADGKLRVWDVSDPRHPEELTIKHARGNENQAVEAVAFSRDGSLLASGGDDQQVVLWRVSDRGDGGPTVERTAGRLLEGQSILSLAFAPDGRTLAAGNGEGSICLFEVENRQAIGDRSCLRGYGLGGRSEGGIEAVKFANLVGGKPVLLTAGTGQPIVGWSSLLWNLSDSSRVEEAIRNDACALAGRNLTAAEWSSVFTSTDLAGDSPETCAE